MNHIFDEKPLRIGARSSTLSLSQTRYVASVLESTFPELRTEIVTIQTKGDRIIDVPLPKIGGKGLFTQELEEALHAGHIDIAVHSLKDLPTEDSPGLMIGAILEREDPRDAYICAANIPLMNLPSGACIGTSSTRRAAQLKHLRPDFELLDIRGNVDTRINKVYAVNSPYDAIVIAHAGLIRINRTDVVTQILEPGIMLPAPAQGALAVQCRTDSPALSLLSKIDHIETRLCTSAERAFLKALGGGCSLPVAALATIQDGQLTLNTAVLSVDGKQIITLSGHSEAGLAQALGEQLAVQARQQGADKLLCH